MMMQKRKLHFIIRKVDEQKKLDLIMIILLHMNFMKMEQLMNMDMMNIKIGIMKKIEMEI